MSTNRYEMTGETDGGPVRGTLQILGTDGPLHSEITAYMIIECKMYDGSWKRQPDKKLSFDKRYIEADGSISYAGFTWKK